MKHHFSDRSSGPTRLQQWEHIRKKGKNTFILWHGIIMFGGSAFLGTLLMVFIWIYVVQRSQLASPEALIILLALSFLGSGYCMGYILWRMNEKAYHRHKQLSQVPEK